MKQSRIWEGHYKQNEWFLFFSVLSFTHYDIYYSMCDTLWYLRSTSMLLSVLNSMRSCSCLKAWFEYWKLNVEYGVSGSSNMSKSPNSFSLSVSLGTPSEQWHKKTYAFNFYYWISYIIFNITVTTIKQRTTEGTG